MIETAKPQLKMAKNRKTAPDFGGKTRTVSYYSSRKTKRTKRTKRTKNRQKPQNRTENRRKPQNRKPLTPPPFPLLPRKVFAPPSLVY